MVTVTIEATGEKTTVLTGEMVNAAVVDKEKCTTMCVSNSEDGVDSEKFIKSLVDLVNNSIKSHAPDKMSEDLLHMLFSMEMRNYTEKRLSDVRKAKASEEDALNAFVEILRKVVEE